MKYLLSILTISILTACGGGGGGKPVDTNDPLMVMQQAQRLMIFTAHADDEALIAPTLASLCKYRTCRVVVATEGSTGICLANLCDKEPLAVVRARELAETSKLLNFDIVQLTLPSLTDDVTIADGLTRWNADNIVRTEIDKFKPEVLITFDPRHGVTTHIEHKMVGALVIRASNFNPANVVLMESELVLGQGFQPWAGTPSYTYNVSDNWSYLYDTLVIHKSQFDQSWLDAARNAPEKMRTNSFTLLKNAGL